MWSCAILNIFMKYIKTNMYKFNTKKKLLIGELWLTTLDVCFVISSVFKFIVNHECIISLKLGSNNTLNNIFYHSKVSNY